MKQQEKIDLAYWAKTCPTSYILITGSLLFGLSSLVYWVLFIKLGF